MKTVSSIIGVGFIVGSTLTLVACGSDSGSSKKGDTDGGAGNSGNTAGAGGASTTGGGGSPTTGTGGSMGGGDGAGPGSDVGGGGASASTGGTVGTGGVLGTGGAVPTGPAGLGSPCAAAKDCPASYLCLGPTSTELGGGGVAHGICTIDCSADITSAPTDPSVCGAAGTGTACLQVSDTKAYCVESCGLGDAASGLVKCHNRRDMACVTAPGESIGFCQPTCRGDFDCPGMTCDLGQGTCTGPIAAPRTLPLGSKCDPTVDPSKDTCLGTCVGFGDSMTSAAGFCSGVCAIGETGCGFDPNSTMPPTAACAFGADPLAGLGDLGFCGQLCDCNDDCTNKDFLCGAVDGLEMQLGHTGLCGPANAIDGGAGIACK